MKYRRCSRGESCDGPRGERTAREHGGELRMSAIDRSERAVLLEKSGGCIATGCLLLVGALWIWRLPGCTVQYSLLTNTWTTSSVRYAGLVIKKHTIRFGPKVSVIFVAALQRRREITSQYCTIILHQRTSVRGTRCKVHNTTLHYFMLDSTCIVSCYCTVHYCFVLPPSYTRTPRLKALFGQQWLLQLRSTVNSSTVSTSMP